MPGYRRTRPGRAGAGVFMASVFYLYPVLFISQLIYIPGRLGPGLALGSFQKIQKVDLFHVSILVLY